MNSISNRVLRKSVLHEDLIRIISKLEEIKSKLYKSSSVLSFSQAINHSFTPEEKDLLDERLFVDGDKYTTNDQLSEFIDWIIESVWKLETLDVTLAFEPTVESLGKILAQIEQKITMPVVVNVKVDTSLVAGIVIEFGGKYGDYSLKKKVEAIL